ncbi:MAG: hypothetical protein Q4B73_10130 [Lachnospiraceae bacterium]|nr:hypothetical protein [Lachnospiraceae bacterium]
MPVWAILLIILGVMVAIFIAVMIFGKKAQKKQEEQMAQIEAAKQSINLLIIDKGRVKIKDSGLPQMVIDQTPRRLRGRKLPIVKAKYGPKISSFIADEKIYDLIPVKKEVRCEVSGLYIIGVHAVRGSLPKPEGKKSFRAKLAAKVSPAARSEANAKNGKKH